MKNNRKNRKLEFIRYKNKLRKGIFVSCTFIKISQSDSNNQDLIDTLSKRMHNDLEKKYKVKFLYGKVTIGNNGDDFIKGVLTLLYTCSNNKRLHKKYENSYNITKNYISF